MLQPDYYSNFWPKPLFAVRFSGIYAATLAYLLGVIIVLISRRLGLAYVRRAALVPPLGIGLALSVAAVASAYLGRLNDTASAHYSPLNDLTLGLGAGIEAALSLTFVWLAVLLIGFSTPPLVFREARCPISRKFLLASSFCAGAVFSIFAIVDGSQWVTNLSTPAEHLFSVRFETPWFYPILLPASFSLGYIITIAMFCVILLLHVVNQMKSGVIPRWALDYLFLLASISGIIGSLEAFIASFGLHEFPPENTAIALGLSALCLQNTALLAGITLVTYRGFCRGNVSG